MLTFARAIAAQVAAPRFLDLIRTFGRRIKQLGLSSHKGIKDGRLFAKLPQQVAAMFLEQFVLERTLDCREQIDWVTESEKKAIYLGLVDGAHRGLQIAPIEPERLVEALTKCPRVHVRTGQ